MEKTFAEKLRDLKHEAYPNCGNTPCWQCPYSYYDNEECDDVCMWEAILEKFNKEDEENN
jgi:hypothetical protein